MGPQIARTFRSYMFTGILVLAPLAITVYILVSGFSILDRFLGTVVAYVAGQRIPGAGAILTLILTFVVGMVATNVMGRRLISFGERIFVRIPVVNAVYVSVKQLLEAFTVQNRSSFKQVVMVQYPRLGVWSVGFLTSQGGEVVQERLGQPVSTVFVPTGPNPTSGFMIIVPDTDIIALDISIESAFKMIVSGGVVMPAPRQASETGADQK